MIFGDFNFDILLTVLDVFNFLWSIFWGELPHTKGVYILDFFCCINHFNSKWRMKHLALFVVGAAFLRPTRCKQNSRIFFCAFSEFPPNACEKAFMSRTSHDFW